MRIKNHTEYLFHPKLEISHCSEGILVCYILGNKISLFENSIDSDFSPFILQHPNKPFSVKDMKSFFLKKQKKYNYGNIICELEKKGLINKADKNQTSLLFLVNFTDITSQKFSTILKEFNLKCDLKLINSVTAKNNYKELNEISNDQVIFVMSDFKNKHKISELNLYFFKKGIFWCPIIIDRFGGYIGPLIHSVPSGPCFNCYEGKMYSSHGETSKTDSFPLLLDIFLRIALLEALKVSANVSPSQVIYSNLLEVDCFNHRSRKHYIFTNSNCTVCGV